MSLPTFALLRHRMRTNISTSSEVLHLLLAFPSPIPHTVSLFPFRADESLHVEAAATDFDPARSGNR